MRNHLFSGSPVLTRASFQLQCWRLGNRLLGGRRWYQYLDFGPGLTNGRWLGRYRLAAILRTQSFLSFLQRSDYLTPEDVVMDIGCNAGLFSFEAAGKCSRVHALEIDHAFFQQARFVKAAWEEFRYPLPNVHLELADVTNNLHLLRDTTIVFASKVLYHRQLGGGLSKLLDAMEKGAVRLILMQGHTTQGEIGRDEGMRRMMEDHGFQYHLAEDVRDYPIAVATRATE